MSNAIVKVDFHGDSLECVEREGKIWVSVRRVCDALGIDHASQVRKLNSDECCTVVIMTTVAEDGKPREMACLELKYLAGWLFSINPGKVKEELRRKLITYKQECYEALDRHFRGAQLPAGEDTDLDHLVEASRLNHEAFVAMQAQRRRLRDVESRVERIEARQEQAQADLDALPAPQVQAPDKSVRASINECVRGYCLATGTDYSDAWAKLYREVNYRCHVDLKARAKNSNRKPIDVADDEGLLPSMYAIAIEVFAPSHAA